MTLLFIALLAAFSGPHPPDTPAPGGDVLKCAARGGTHPDMPESVYIVDDEVFEGDVSTWDPPELDDIWSVELMCWRWIEAHFGFRIRSTGIYVATKEGMERYRASAIGALDVLALAQVEYQARNGGYAVQVQDLSDFGTLSDHGLPDHFQLELKVDDDGWAARVGTSKEWRSGFEERGSNNPLPTCLVLAGTAPAGWGIGPKGKTRIGHHQPVCL